jgi:hypothetical protein
VVGHSRANESPVLKMFLSRLEELIGLASNAGARSAGRPAGVRDRPE